MVLDLLDSAPNVIIYLGEIASEAFLESIRNEREGRGVGLTTSKARKSLNVSVTKQPLDHLSVGDREVKRLGSLKRTSVSMATRYER